jgi:hypothetical protein
MGCLHRYGSTEYRPRAPEGGLMNLPSNRWIDRRHPVVPVTWIRPLGSQFQMLLLGRVTALL